MSRFIKSVLGSIASLIVFPPILIVILHKIRGVKFKKTSKVFISYNVCIDNLFPELIEIGEDVKITRNVTILSHFHPTKSLSKYYGEMVTKKVTISDGVFIGIGAIILPGVTIGKGALVAAGAVVNKDVPQFAVVAGNPAKIVKYLVPHVIAEEVAVSKTD